MLRTLVSCYWYCKEDFFKIEYEGEKKRSVQQSPDLLPQRLEALRTPVCKSRPVVEHPRTVNPSYQSDQKYIVHKNKNMINKKIKFYH